MLLGIETSGPVFAAARRITEPIMKALFCTTFTARATSLVVLGNPNTQTILSKFEDLVPGGVQWRIKERKLKTTMDWVHCAAAEFPLYCHTRPEPLFCFHTSGNHDLVLDLVKGDNFLDLFPRNTPASNGHLGEGHCARFPGS
jgi:hypothetical protein